MVNGLQELLKAERSNLLMQVAQINDLLGDTPVVGSTNGNGTPVKPGRGVSAAIVAMLHEDHSLKIQEIAGKLKEKGFYFSKRKATGSAGALLSQMKRAGTVARNNGAWTLAR